MHTAPTPDRVLYAVHIQGPACTVSIQTVDSMTGLRRIRPVHFIFNTPALNTFELARIRKASPEFGVILALF